MEKASTTKPPKPSIGLKLQNSPFLANTQSNTPNNNLKSAPVKKKTTTPAWLQKQEFSSFKRASLQKMSQKVSSNPWKKDNSTSLPTSKLPTPTANSNKSSSSSTKTLPTKIKGPPLNKPQGTRHSIQKAKVKGDQKASGSAHGVGTSTMGSVPESGVNIKNEPVKQPSTKPVEEPVIQSRLATPSTTLVEKSSIDTDSSIIHNTSQVPSDNDNQPINTKSPLPVQSTQMSVTRSSSTPEPASPAISESPSSSSLIVKVENSTDLSPSLPALYQQQEASLADITNFNNLSEITLPWSQHTQEQLQQIEKQQHAAITTDYDTFFQQLVVSHAISSALYFPTVSFDQAQKLHKRYLKSNDHIDMIGTRLLTETKAQRMILSMHKLSTTHTSSAMPDLVEEKESDRLDQVDRLVEELIQWMHRDYSRREQYLQHLAGTLAKQCTHLEQINHSITGNSSLLTLSMTQNTTDAIIMMKKETQWILALRHDIIQLFEHHLPTVTLPPSPVTSPSQSISTMSSSSSSAIGGSNEEEGDLFLNSNRTSMTSATTDHQQAHLYHRHHQNMVSEIKHLIQLLDQQLASRQVGMTPTEELETKLANEKQLNDTLAGQVTKLQEKWDQEVERNQALVDGLRSEHTRLTVALDEEKRRTQQLETRLGNHRQEQEEDQDKLDHLEACLAQEKQQGAALQTRLELANKELAYQMEERDRLVLELQSQLANDIQHQRSLVNQYFSDGDATVEMALAQLCKERDDARMESQGWQAKAEGLNVELDEWQTKAEGLDKERQEWQTKAEGLDKERQEWRIKAEGLDKERQEWQTKAEGLELELETTHRTMTTLQNDQSASALQVNALETRLQQLSKDKQNLEDQQTLSDDRLAEAQQQIQALTVKIADLEQDDWRQKYKDLETRFDMAQQQFTHRESGYLLQSASVEAELEQVLKEYDRLTRHIVDFNSERKKYEQQISDMNQYQHRLDQQLADLQVQHLGDSQGTTMALRKEFRQLMAHTKATYQQELDKEQQLRSTLEQERRAEKQEVERLRWDRVNVSVQTHFVV